MAGGEVSEEDRKFHAENKAARERESERKSERYYADKARCEEIERRRDAGGDVPKEDEEFLAEHKAARERKNEHDLAKYHDERAEFERVKSLVEQSQHITQAEREVYDKVQRKKERRNELRDTKKNPVAAYNRRSERMLLGDREAKRLKVLTRSRESNHVTAPPGKLGVDLVPAFPGGARIGNIRDGSRLVGVNIGDRIVQIDGKDVSELSRAEVIKIMRGKSGLRRHLVMRGGVLLTDVLDTMTNPELRTELLARGLAISGCKTMMKQRIMESIARLGNI